MSIASLSRRVAQEQIGAVRSGSPTTEGRFRGMAPGESDASGRERPPTASSSAQSEGEMAREALTQYFPTETITIFLGAVALWQLFDKTTWQPSWMQSAAVLIATFTIATPLMLLLVAYAIFREATRADPAMQGQVFVAPWFDMIAAAAAFFVWAFAVPGLFDANAVVQVAAAFGAFVLSWILSQLRRIVGPVRGRNPSAP